MAIEKKEKSMIFTNISGSKADYYASSENFPRYLIHCWTLAGTESFRAYYQSDLSGESELIEPAIPSFIEAIAHCRMHEHVKRNTVCEK